MTWSRNVSIPNTTGMFVGDPAVAIDGGGTMYAVCQEYLNVGIDRQHPHDDVDRQGRDLVGDPHDRQRARQALGGRRHHDDGTVFVSWLGNPGGIKRSIDRGDDLGTDAVARQHHPRHRDQRRRRPACVHVPYNLDSNRNQLRYLRSKDNGDT